MGKLARRKHHATASGAARSVKVCGYGVAADEMCGYDATNVQCNVFERTSIDYKNGAASRATPSRNLIGRLLASSCSIVTCFDCAFFTSKISFRLSASFWP